MTQEDVINKINWFLIEEFEVKSDSIKPEANLKESLGLDSLDYVDLVVIIESNFGFKVKGEDFIGIVTFQDFYNYILSKMNSKSNAGV